MEFAELPIPNHVEVAKKFETKLVFGSIFDHYVTQGTLHEHVPDYTTILGYLRKAWVERADRYFQITSVKAKLASVEAISNDARLHIEKFCTVY